VILRVLFLAWLAASVGELNVRETGKRQPQSATITTSQQQGDEDLFPACSIVGPAAAAARAGYERVGSPCCSSCLEVGVSLLVVTGRKLLSITYCPAWQALPEYTEQCSTCCPRNHSSFARICGVKTGDRKTTR